LRVWQAAMDLVPEVYHLTKSFPAEERFGLSAQVRRAVVGVPSDIAEGHGRSSKADFLRFLDMALGSLNETETQLLAAAKLGYLEEPQLIRAFELSEGVRGLTKALIASLRRSRNAGVRTQGTTRASVRKP
jgi:four helix bundle protein